MGTSTTVSKIICASLHSQNNITASGNIVASSLSASALGINTTNPNSSLQISGSFSTAISTKTSDYTITSSDYTILVDCSSTVVTIELPTVVNIEGRVYNIKCIDDTYTCNVTTNATEQIDNSSATIVLIQDEVLTLQTNGEKWYII